MWIFDFIRRNASRVFSVISTFYFLIIAAARFAFDWAVNEARKALDAAKAFTSIAIDVLNFTLTVAIDWTRNFLLGIIDNTKTFFFNLIEFVRLGLVALIDWSRNYAIQFINDRIADVLKIIAGINDALDKAFRFVLDQALKPYKWLIENRTKVLNIIAFWSPANLAKVAQLMLIDFAAIVAAVSNPVGTFIAIARQFSLSLLEWLLAYALGTVKLDLPPWPNWLEDTAPGSNPIISSPPPTGRVIGRPLSALSISGNRFTTGHPGIDLGCRRGEPVFAMHDGVIEESRFSNVGFGFFVTVRGSDWWTRYAHLASPGTPVGTQVSQGDAIGACDTTGNSTGDHLHLEIKYRGSFVNPLPLLGLS